MLHTIVFTDNIFILSRILSLISQSLELDYSEELFNKKIESDVIYSSELIKRIFEMLTSQEHLHDFLDSMKCLYSCSVKLLDILTYISNNSESLFKNSPELLGRLKRQQTEMRDSIAKKVQNTDVDAEIINIVSEMEMAELLNFKNESIITD